MGINIVTAFHEHGGLVYIGDMGEVDARKWFGMYNRNLEVFYDLPLWIGRSWVADWEKLGSRLGED